MRLQQTLLYRTSMLALLALANTAVGGTALAADFGGPESQGKAESQPALPAVSGLNAKIGAFGASLADESAAGVFVGLALPLGHSFGAQIDGLVGTAEGGNAFHGVGGHLFWRDPARALFGIYASHVQWDTGAVTGGADRVEVNKAGFEGQLYLGRLSLEGLAAYQFGTESGFAGKGTVAYYPRDDLRLHAGVTHKMGPGFGAFTGLEWAPLPSSGLSLFADVGVGVNEDRDVRALFGLKLYLSRSDKPLIRRHREDDPEVDLPRDLFHAGQANPPPSQPNPPSQGEPCPVGQIFSNGFCDGNT